MLASQRGHATRNLGRNPAPPTTFSPDLLAAIEECDIATLNNHLNSLLTQCHPDTGWGALHTVCYSLRAPSERKIEALALLLENGADVNQVMGNEVWTPLHAAAVGGDAGVVRFLLDRGARTDIEDGRCGTPLKRAVEDGCADVVDAMLGRGARGPGGKSELWIWNGGIETTLLHFAASLGQVGVVELLLERGGREVLEAWDFGGMTPLTSCVDVDAAEFVDAEEWKARERVAEVLVAAGADVAKRDRCGITALHGAARYGFRALVVRCLDCGIDVNDTGDRGGSGGTPQHKDDEHEYVFRSTPLHQAVQGEHVEVVKLLLSRGAKPAVPDLDGKHALHHLLDGWERIKDDEEP